MVERGYKRKTIVNIIKYNINKWLETVEDEALRKEMKAGYIVTGGAITSMLLGEKPNDYDVYFNDVNLCKKVAEYYLAKLKIKNEKITGDKNNGLSVTTQGDRVLIGIKSAGVASETSDGSDYDYFEMSGDMNLFLNNLNSELQVKNKKNNEKKTPKTHLISLITTNAISLTNNIQIITRFTGPAKEIHKNYDFVHTTNYFTEAEGLVLNLPAMEATITKELKYVGSKYPLCSMFRLRKFINRGWTITAGEMLKIGWDISKLNLSDRLVLQDQLVGVDSAYFTQLFSILNAPENKEKAIDRTYIYELINRIFDGDEGGSDLTNTIDMIENSDMDELPEM